MHPIAVIAVLLPGILCPLMAASSNKLGMELEQARYLYDVEANPSKARYKLQQLLQSNAGPEISAKAHFLLGKTFDDQLTQEKALEHYHSALRAAGLPNEDRAWLYERLLQVAPESVSPLSAGNAAVGRVMQNFLIRQSAGPAYFLVTLPQAFQRGQAGSALRELGLQNAIGEYQPIDLRPSPQEEVLDANARYVLFFLRSEGLLRIVDWQAGLVRELQVDGELNQARFSHESELDFFLLGSSYLERYRGEVPIWRVQVPGSDCRWAPMTHTREEGFLVCQEDRLFEVSLRSSRLAALPALSQPPLDIQTSERFLLIKYLSRFEVRSTHEPAQVLWSRECHLQDKAYLTGKGVYLLSTNGVLSRLSLHGGQLEWQKDLLGQQLITFQDRLYLLTLSQTCSGLSPSGQTQWSYEYGWDHEIQLLPGSGFLVIHYSDGKRVKLHEDILTITSRSSEYQFNAFRRHRARGQWNLALNSLDEALKLEPGNGMAWELRYKTLKQLGAERPEQLGSLIRAARSLHTPVWSSEHVLEELAGAIGADWIWKRSYGQKFYPILIPAGQWIFYLESDNQTLVLLDRRNGKLVDSYHFPEELDARVHLWRNDTLCISSPSRLYLISPEDPPGKNVPVELENPVCQAIPVENGVLYSDWQGNLFLLEPGTRENLWQARLAREGLLLHKGAQPDQIDVVSLSGRYFRVRTGTGEVVSEARLPVGTVTEIFSLGNRLCAAYNDGRLVSMDKESGRILWTRDFSEQIFSLSGTKENILMLTTASKRMISLDASAGELLSQSKVPISLFNRPTPSDTGYWIGTTEPALELRNTHHKLLQSYSLPDIPGNPVVTSKGVYVSTLGNFILGFELP